MEAVQLALDGRELLLELLAAGVQGLVALPEAEGGQLPLGMEVEEAVEVGLGGRHLRAEAGLESCPVLDHLVGLEQDGRDGLGREPLLHLGEEDGLQVVSWGGSPADLAAVAVHPARDVHLSAALADHVPREEVLGGPARPPLLLLRAGVEHGVHLVPDLVADDGLDLDVDPLGLGLGEGPPSRLVAIAVVGPSEPL